MSMIATDDTAEAAVPGSVGSGAQLRLAREAAGLSLEQVAQQLKLAPRQVKAVEEEDFTHLPGRTFTRGFVRNYARLLNLDAERLLALLPDAAHAPSLEAPALQSTGTMIAELPGTTPSGSNFGRWLIPLVLVGCIVAAAGYEWYRGGLPKLNDVERRAADATDRVPASPAAAPPTSTQLPNPLTAATPPDASGVAAAPVSDAPATPAPSKPDAPALPDAPLVLTFSGPSWADVRDRNGQSLISRLASAGSTESIHGVAPFDVVLGNAHMVTLVYRGKTLDLAPYTRQNVARLRLQ